MTPEAQAADALLAYSGQLNALLDRHPWVALGAAAVAGLAVLLPHATAASVRPSAETRVSRVRPQRPAGSAEGGTPSERDTGKAVRVSGKKEPAPKVWAVPGLVPHGPLPRRRWPCFWRWERRGYITCILGSGGTGKSYVLLDLALAALGGGSWFGLPVRPVRAVLYVDTELDAEECQRRAYPLARGRGRVVPPDGLHYLHLGASLASEEGQAAVLRGARKVAAELILVDSMTIGSFDVAAADQNGWNRVYTGMERWGAPVVCIDHLDKAGRGAFGSMMKQAKVRSMLQLTRRGDGSIRVEHTKSNFGPKAEPFVVYAEFGEGPGAATRFTTDPPSAPEVRPRTDAVAQTTPPVLGTSHPAPVPLRVVPRREAPHDSCEEILRYVRAHPGPWPKNALRDALDRDGILKKTAAYQHLNCLTAAGLLRETADGLALPGADDQEAGVG